jgi:D-glycero-D-manno-heptose 1,7-bisphosphate phosphatase
VYLDRDGVIIENRPDHVKSWDEVEILDGAVEALVELSRTDVAIVIVTNQGVVGQKIITEAEAGAINSRLCALIEAAGGRVDAVYMCPHDKTEECLCRKPKPGMLFHAQQELDIDLSRSVMIGDAVTDLMAAGAAHVEGVMVLTGRGAQQQQLMPAELAAKTRVFPDLGAAIHALLPRFMGSNSYCR